MSSSGKIRRYSPEVRERAVRMLFDHEHEYPSRWQAIVSIAAKLDVHRETLRAWVRHAEEAVHAGNTGIAGPGQGELSPGERERLRALEQEVKELRRANEILKAAAGFFARELDPRLPKS